MEFKDYYAILEIKRDASQEEVKIAYRKLALKYHPDLNPNNQQSEEKAKDLNEAYQIISDIDKRRQYDHRSAYHKSRFSDLFEKVFGSQIQNGAQKQTAAPRSYKTTTQTTHSTNTKTLEYPVSITLKEAFMGTVRNLHISGGRIEIKIPAGVKSGTQVNVKMGAKTSRIENQQEVFIKVEVLGDNRFLRKGDDLYTEVAVNLYIAILGGNVSIDTITGKGILAIPPATQPDQLFRLKGKGMPHLQQPDQYGDLYAQVKIHLPEQLTDHQKALFELLASTV